MKGTMMVLIEQAGPITARLRLDVEDDMVTECVGRQHGPMVSESYVADAMSHLLGAFLILDDPGTISRSPRGSAASLGSTAENISIAINQLNHCSVAFWRHPKDETPAAIRLREIWNVYKCKRGASDARRNRDDFAGGRTTSFQARERFTAESSKRFLSVPTISTMPDPGSTHQARLSGTNSEWEHSLALAILHLVRAYEAMEMLSASSFPLGAPESFELVCHCLCTALTALDTCWSSSEGC
jgi:hypothetical protein